LGTCQLHPKEPRGSGVRNEQYNSFRAYEGDQVQTVQSQPSTRPIGSLFTAEMGGDEDARVYARS